jgi:hypothetical protein
MLGSASVGAVASACVNAAMNLWIKRMELRRERVAQAIKLVELAVPSMERIRQKDGALHPADPDYSNPASLLSEMMEKVLQAEKKR